MRLLSEDKLELLRSLDEFRSWESLDDQRYCLVCGHMISGRQIQVLNGTGPARLQCPTENCSSTSMDWALPGAGPKVETVAR